MTILDRIIERKRKEMAGPRRRRLSEALSGSQLAVIAEFKRRSPSKGAIAEHLDPVRQAKLYAEGGASALSVLTDEEDFGGSLADLQAIGTSAPAELAVMRKDFIVDPLQLAEAAAAGASAALLIVAALSPKELTTLLGIARTLGLDALVEVHDEGELRRALEAGAEIVGVNNRDLRTFKVDLATSERLRPLIPPGVLAVAESGIQTPDDARRMARAGFDGVLIGEALMRDSDPGGFIALCREEVNA